MKFGLLTYFDLFRLPINLYFEGSIKRASMIGLISSFGIYLFLIYAFTQSDLFLKKSPSVVYQSNQIRHAKNINFDENSFLMISLSDPYDKKYMDDSIFTIQFKFFINESYAIYKTLKPCSFEDVGYNSSLFEVLRMQNGYCLENKSFNLEGYWEDKDLHFVAINIFECDNSTSGGKCKSHDQIKTFFADPLYPKFLGVTFIDSQIDLYDYSTPFKPTFRVEYLALDNSLRKRMSYFIKIGKVDTDDGIIFSSSTVKSNVMFNSKDFDFQLRNSSKEPFAQIFFYSAKEEVMCTRRYQKLPEILGSLTGIANLIMFFCMLGSNLVTYISTLEFILNRLYIFPEIIKEPKKKKTKISKKTKKKQETLVTLQQETTIPTTTKEFGFSNQIPLSTIDFKEERITKKNEREIIKKEDPKNDINKTSFLNDNDLKKELKNDSFVLDHYSEENKQPQIPENKPDVAKDSHHYTDNDKNKLKDSLKEVATPRNSKIKDAKFSRLRSLLKVRPTFFQSFHQIDENKNRLKIKVFGYIKYIVKFILCLKKTKKEEMISQAEKAFKNDMDIVNIITKLHDLEKLKILLLNEDQLALFNYLSKPMINFGKGDQLTQNIALNSSNFKMSRLMNSSKLTNDIEETYKRVNTYQNFDKINQRLIELFDERVCSWRKNL